MTTANPSNYWISGNALRITLNANGDADYIQGNTASGAMILCFIKDVSGLGYDAGHNYQRWKLLLSPTYFATKSVKYVYVAIPRAGKKVPQDFAQVVFPSEKLDIYGKNASEQQIGSTDYYYIWLQGIISASEVGGVLQDRVWTAQIQTGTLASDEAFESGGDSTWWRYSSVSDTVTFLKTIAHAVFERMRVTTRLIFGNSDDSENYVSGVANNNTSDTSEHDIVTPAYGKEKFLSRKNNDTASGWITFIKGLRTVIDFVSGATGSGGAFYQEQSGTYSRSHLETDVARIREMLLGSLDVEENLHVGGSETIGTSAAGQNTMADGTTVDNYRQKVGGNARIDGVLLALSKIYSNLLRSQNFNGDGLFDSGFELTKDDGTGHSYLVVDKLYVRLKAIFEALEIRKMIYSGGNFIFSHAGGKVVKVREIREELTASVDGNTLMLTGPVNITGSTLYIDGGARVENGTLVITGESTLYAYRCYFLTDDGTTRTENWWQVDDQARCQTYNIKEGVYEHVSNQSYWRRVLAVGRETLDDGKEYDYIDLSVVDCMSGSTVPKEGDDLVQCGNRTDPERQGFITLEIAGEYAPALKIYKNVNGYTTSGKRKICLSPKYTELIVNKFVQETEYDVQQVPMERGEWELIPGNKCYYYNLVQHNGASWLCIYPEEGVNGVLYTVEEPSENAVWWRPYAQRGKDGEDGKSFNIKGTFDTYAEFDAAEKVYEEGVAYVVAGFLYIYDPLVNNFKNAGQFKGDPGRGIKSATISYGVSDSSSVTPNEWKSSPSALALEQGVYLWVRTILVYTDGEQSSPSYNISYFGKDGSFKNTVFCRTNTDISSLQPNGGTWDSPIPNPSSGVVWSDGIPAGESRLWATSAVFSPTGQMSEWTKPKPMTDTTDTDVEFSPSTAKPANPSDVISEREAQGWYDPDRNPSFDFTTTIWRAERHCKNGIWGNWAVERIKGEKGDSITIDAQNSKTEYVASNQGTSAPSSGWSTTIPSVPQGQFLWTRVTTVYSDGSSTVSYGVSYNAADGADGADGTSVTITSKSVKYAVTNNGTQPADSSFTYNSIPPLELGQYLWTKTEVAYSDGNSTKAYSVSRLGTDGAQGVPGPNGKTTHFAYAMMKAGQSIPSTGKITTAMVDSWSRINFPGADAIGTYDDTTTEDSDNIADYTWTEWKGDKGEKGDSITVDVQKSKTEYAASSQGTSAPSSGWSTTIPDVPQGQFLWTRVTTAYSDGSSTVSYGVSYNAEDGTPGTSITITSKSVKYAVTNNGTQPADSSFTYNAIPSSLKLGQYLWTKTEVVYSDGNSTKAYSVSRLGTDGPQGIQGPNGKTTHFAYAMMKAGQSIPSTGKITTAMVDSWSRINFPGADAIGTYDDTTTEDSDNIADYTWTKWKGEKGDSVTVDAQKSKTEYAASNQGTSAPSSGWSTTIPSVPQGQFLWTRVTTVYSDGSSTVSYGVSYNAADGADGADGTSVTITSKSVKYAVTNNGTQPADSSFTYNSIPPLELGQYLWTKTEVAYSDGNSTKAYSVSRLGTDGAQGVPGPNGKTTHFAYAMMKAGQSIPSTGKITTAMVDSWSRINFPGADAIGTYDDTTTEDSDNIADYTWTEWKGDKGEKGDSITVDVQKSKTEYAASSQGTSAPSSGWSTTIPDVPQGQFLWTRVTTAYSDGSSTVSYGVSYNAEDGTPGTSITITSKSVKYAVTNNGTQPADSSFTYNAIPSSLKLGQYLWTKTEVVYSDGNSTKAYSVSRLGTDGPQGIQGPNGKTTHFAYAKMKAGQSIPSTGKITTAMVDSWSRTNFSGADAIGTYDDTTTEDSDNIADYTWTEWKGDKGEKGDSITVDVQKSKTEYAASSQGTSAPSSGWSTTIPDVPQGQFLWTRVTTAYSDGSSTVSYGVSYNAEDGTPGTSITITSKSVKYAVTNNGTQPADSSFTYNAIPSSLKLGQYLWTKTEVVYSDGNSTKAYSVSRLGTDGPQGIQGPNGKTTHFAYAKMKAGQSIPSTGKITTAMVDSWSRTNFSGADAIGTYDDTTTEDSDNIADYTWTEWKGEKGDKGDSGSSAASVVLDTSVISVPVDTDGYVIDNFHAEVGVRLYVAGKDVVATEISIDEQDGSSLVSAPANALAAMPWATEDDYELNDGQINFKRNASINENTLVLTGDAWAVVPDRLIVEVKKGTQLREHAANLTVGGSDEDKNYIEGFASIAIQRQYVPTNGREGADAVSMMLTKYNVILNQQQSGAKTIPLDDAYTDVMAYVGDMNVTGNAVITATPSKVDDQPVCAVSVSGGRVTITSIGTYKETVDGKEKTYYYDKGEVFIQVSYNGKKYPLVFGFSCNLLGTWKEETENDINRAVAAKINYLYDDENPNQVVKQADYAEYVRSATENTSRISEQVEYLGNGKNLIKELTRGWVGADPAIDTVTYGNYWSILDSSGDLYSPVIRLQPNTWYCFSAIFDNNPDDYSIYVIEPVSSRTYNNGNELYNSGHGTTPTITWHRVGSTYRFYFTFKTGNTETLFAFNYYPSTNCELRQPQLELGEVPTEFFASSYEQSSLVKQTKDALTIQINGKASTGYVDITERNIVAKINQTGIDIDKKKITLNSETTEISNNGKTTAMFEDGKIKAEYINVATLIAQQLLTEADSSGIQVKIEKGLMEVYGQKGVANWRFGIDGSGNTILAYYNNSGQKLYDLGPNGISSINNFYESWGEDNKYYFPSELFKSSPVDGVLSTVFSSSVIYRNIFSDGHKTTPTYLYGARKTGTGTSTIYYGKDTDATVEYAANQAVARAADNVMFWDKNDLKNCTTAEQVANCRIHAYTGILVSEEPLQPINFNGMSSSDINHVLTQVKAQYYTPNESYYETLPQKTGIPFVFPTVNTVSQYPLYMRTLRDSNGKTFTILSNSKF